MKKILCAILAIILLLAPISANAQNNETISHINQSSRCIDDNDMLSSNTVSLSMAEINSLNSINKLKQYIQNGGIIIVDNTVNYASLCLELGMQFVPEFIYTNPDEHLKNSGTDVATIYYNYGNDLSGIYIINSQNTITESEKESLIQDAVNEILSIQNSSKEKTVQPLASNNSGKTLGSLTVTTTRMPKGKLKATYTFFTVQNYGGKDYYIAKANINGYPGATLSTSDSNYQSKYKGEELTTIIKTSTSSVTVDSYGPHRTIGSSSYSVSVGSSFNANSGTTFGANFSYSKNIVDTNIEATSTTKQAEWDVTLKSSAKSKTITFVPAVTFVCPESKSSINITLSSNYVVDSWNTFNETLSVSRTVTCTPSNVS